MMYHNEYEGADIIPMLAQNMCNVTIGHKLHHIVS